MSLKTYEVAGQLVNWRARRERDVIDWPAGSRFADNFIEHLCSRYRDQHRDDVKAIVEAFGQSHPSLVDWYAAILQTFDHDLIIEDGAPRLRLGALSRWRGITTFIDPDALVTLRLAQSLPRSTDPRQAVADLPGWRFYLDMADHGLEQVLQRGLADIHVHFEASDPMPILWLRVATGRVHVTQLQFYSDGVLAKLDDEKERRKRDRTLLGNAAKTRDALCRRAGLAMLGTDAGLRDQIAHERQLLIAVWRMALQGGGQEIHREIDHYLFAKNLFVRRHQQRPGIGPGLSRFRDYLDRGETRGEKRGKRTSPRMRRERFDRMLHLATEAPTLRFLELRIAPPRHFRGWCDLFRLWQKTFDGQGIAKERGVEIRFVVHFIRNPDATECRSCAMHFGKLRHQLDRQTADFQRFRARCPELARYVTGIDVANLERGSPPEVFAPYLALLRGNDSFAGGFDHDALRAWESLKSNDEHRPPTVLPKLGLTYHAGEDFHHPVDGMRAISGLLEKVLHPGDRIGHGLAPGLDVARFRAGRGMGPIPCGVLLDDLVWLRREATKLGRWTGSPQSDVDQTIGDLVWQIYKVDYSRSVLERALLDRFEMPRPTWKGAAPERDLLYREAFDDGVRAARAAIAEQSARAALENFDDGILAAVQDALIRKISDSGIMVEANPSSNLITGTVGRLSEHPFFRYRAVLGGEAAVSINTDDPGVFGTRIDVEFALMFEAMMGDLKMSRSEALKTLEGARRLGFDYAFGGSTILGRP